MTDFGVWYTLAACIATIWLALPIHVALHEFSHAIAARALSDSKIKIQLGSTIHGVWRQGKFEISFGLSRWRSGNFQFVEKKANSWKQALIITAGPAGTLMLTLLSGYALLWFENLGIRLALIPFFAYGLKILILSLYPNELRDKETGEKIQTDGFKLTRIPWRNHSTANL